MTLLTGAICSKPVGSLLCVPLPQDIFEDYVTVDGHFGKLQRLSLEQKRSPSKLDGDLVGRIQSH